MDESKKNDDARLEVPLFDGPVVCGTIDGGVSQRLWLQLPVAHRGYPA